MGYRAQREQERREEKWETHLALVAEKERIAAKLGDGQGLWLDIVMVFEIM